MCWGCKCIQDIIEGRIEVPKGDSHLNPTYYECSKCGQRYYVKKKMK